MMNRSFLLFFFYFISLTFGISVSECYGQHKKIKIHHSLRDSLRREVLKRDSMMRTFKHTDNSLNALLQKIELYNSLYNQDFSDLSQAYDTLDVSENLPLAEKRLKVIGSLIQNEHSGSIGYLFTIRDIVGHFKDNLDTWQNTLNGYNTKLDKILSDAGEFKSDTAMHSVPSDSSLKAKYLPQILSIQHKWRLLDSTVQKDLVKIGLLQNRATSADLAILDINDQIDAKIHDFTVGSFTNEYGFLWEKSKQDLAPFDTVSTRTIALNSKLLKYFFDLNTTNRINIISHLAVIVVFVSFFLWIYSSRRKLARSKDDHVHTLNQTKYAAQNSFFSALIIAIILALYFYDQPPFIFPEILLLVMMACIGVLIKQVWPRPLFKFWLCLFVLTVFYAATNLFIQTSYADRIFLLLLSAASITIGAIFLKELYPVKENYPPYTGVSIALFTLFNVIAFILNLIGRFSLAKIIGVATIFNLCLGFGFYLFIQVIMESLFLQLESNKSAKKSFSSYVDFNVLQNKFKSALVKIAIVLWFVKLLENLYIDDYLYSVAADFLTHPYKFGTTALTFGSLVIFVVVLWLSIIISRVISYFYDYAAQQSAVTSDIKKTRTSILLIRLSVFSLGFIAAITISGIPLSEITIVVGALGVGIGFGLQNIVNNLVSGVILAFEKPVQVGDIIEVGNRSGVIKEIGIRATKIEAGNGSELIVPNGDLISQHLINWTLTNNNRQIELIVGVAYGSDITKVAAILKRILKDRADIMQDPPPSVFLHNFSDSSVDFRLLFWAADIKKWVSLKSNVMIEVYTQFAAEGIEIPHPKRDIQVFFPEGTNAEIKNQENLKEILPDKGTLK